MTPTPESLTEAVRLLKKRGIPCNENNTIVQVLATALDEHKAKMREVSDAVKRAIKAPMGMDQILDRFIIPEPPIDPQAGEVWSYKGNDYKVRSLETNHLVQFEDEWVPAVEYENYPDKGLTFYRALPDFLAKFSRNARIVFDAPDKPDAAEVWNRVVKATGLPANMFVAAENAAAIAVIAAALEK